ncbi:DegT/DnrJ/EryC1/StrS family aminotransferase [Crocosphaera watsonii WH 8501]|uniref:DegT/DnrJ/EryC1/StrS aminotransferase n=5 Tax=Crocosphaera watsonii TaxID=263511 RepID=Q4BW05_CROWT|nr:MULTISPECIES: DegT/DnrJ/EryC1/StrS family aminotransferase [Crocosphaera]EAM48086.1 DegT/DnrJ/EryC1/StrS aminotransferase [Crocosphaera watsonii WH 8501]EHJ15314.1 pleiotropic regulatory protein [Crocosphaera watsonii WH 0003]MCH2248121.1 DegT/DnrJ/EryC1/StrS family aminotransferase [Crocosphaera sp.]NQZ64996.1 DegT/DnrJ/EryC1/StrS family aminotransferase [Crocosphaera sp.]CCQ50614.1 pleiotropic regulatory protein [Crocosphaera watsonii WH 8502]
MPVNTIPPVDLVRQYKLISEEVDRAVLEVVRSGRYIGGEVVKDFEEQLAKYVGSAHCIGCNSGTDALYLALRALNIGAGDEVITTPFTFIATTETVSLVGAKPVFVDIERDTLNMDVGAIEAAITPQTKAIIPVHLFGQPVNMARLMDIAQKHNLYVIEDCAQSTGAKWEEDLTGNIGHVGCFSFFPTKNLGTCGDGGAVTTNDPAIAETIKVIKEHGSAQRYYHDVVGINSRLDSIQAAILRVKLSYLDQWNKQRREISQRYHQLLAGIPGIQLPQEIKGGYHVWNQYTILVKNHNNNEKTTRDDLREKLQENGIISMIYYPIPLHLQKVYHNLGYQKGAFSVTEEAANEVLSLPMFPDISPEEQEQVAYALRDYFA